MHVLHRPHFPRALTITALAAVIATVVTLAAASTLSDLASPSSSSPSRSIAPSPLTAATAGQEAIRPAWTLSPFSSLLGAPVSAPWARHEVFP